jgi:hypothetical protein
MCSFVETNELFREQCSRIHSFVQTSEQFAKYGQTNELIRELFAKVCEQFANFAGPKFPIFLQLFAIIRNYFAIIRNCSELFRKYS